MKQIPMAAHTGMLLFLAKALNQQVYLTVRMENLYQPMGGHGFLMVVL